MLPMIRTLAPYAAAFTLGLFLAATAQHWRYTAQISEIRTQHATASQAAVESALAKQQRLNKAAESAGQQGESELEQIRNDIRADDSADRLREELAAVRRRATSDNASAATQRLTDRQTIGMLTHMLESCSGFAGVVAGGFEDSRTRGLTCQHTYNNARQAMQ